MQPGLESDQKRHDTAQGAALTSGVNAERITSVDVVRGFAVLGILVMNIVAFAMPLAAYDDPTIYGGASGADLAAWGAATTFADGKMRGLFTLLFGASIAIVADAAARRGANPVEMHYWRMGWLLVIGMLHGALLWYGDILVEYAITGAILFAAWRWRPAALFYVAAVLFVAELAIHVDDLRAILALKAAALQPDASATDLSAWQARLGVSAADIRHQLDAYRGDAASVFAIRRAHLLVIAAGLPYYVIEAVATAAFGMALYRTGYFTRWSAARHHWLILAGIGIALPLTGVATLIVGQQGVDPVNRTIVQLVVAATRPAIMLGYASLLILMVDSDRIGWLIDRLAAAGRMALTNYLATSVVMTTVFYGYGLGWFGYLSRAQLIPLVLAMWMLILLWSAPWLRHFRYGPVEWLWRSLTIGRQVAFRRPDRSTSANHPQ